MKKLVLTVLICCAIAIMAYNNGYAFEMQKPTDRPSTIHVGSEFYPPLEFVNEKNEPAGFIPELRQAIAERNGESVQIKLLQWDQAQAAVQQGSAESIALIASDERAELYEFTQPFFYVAHGIFSHRDGPQFGNLEQLTGQRIAVVNGAFAAQNLQQETFDATLVIARSELECLELVADFKAEACIEVTLSSSHLAAIHDLPVEMSSPPFWPMPYVFAVKKGNKTLIDQLNAGLASVIVDGTYKAIFARWADQLEWKPTSFWEQAQQFTWVAAALLTLTLFALICSWSLKRTVAQKTAALQTALERSHQLQEQLAHSAIHDSATGLLNRNGFFNAIDDFLNHDITSNASHIVAVQITNINSIVTALGYESALLTINNFGDRLREVEQSFAAHLGTGLFILKVTTIQPLSELIEKLQQPLYDNRSSFEPELAFGAATLEPLAAPSKHVSASEYVRRAITALAYVREKRLVFASYNDKVEPNNINLRLLNDFNKFGCSQLVLHYQPQIDLEHGRVYGAEALVRWDHPKFGLIPPAHFIPLFEESGAITKITRWVITEVTAMLQRLGADLEGLKISVNITNRDLVDDSFIDFVRNTCATIPPGQLIFEITESDILADSTQVERAMTELKSIGIICAIDDFGTGYSTLSYLNDLSVEEIKIDKSFISIIDKNERARKIVASTIQLAHELDLTVVAEGVETQATLALLQMLKCNRVQGYYYAKPLPEAGLTSYLSGFTRAEL